MAFIPQYIFILFATITVDYIAGRLIEPEVGKKRRLYLIISIISTCLVLFVFKYFNFFNANFDHMAKLLHWNYPIGSLSIILPIGLSFHTFQSLSYVIEVYRGNQKAERNFGIYSLYVMFYPQLVAGPIERPQNLLHQFYEKHTFDIDRVKEGLLLMFFGLFKKLVIADQLAIYVNKVYDHPTNYHGLPLIITTVFFAFQIYCDFSGYSDIAIGAAKVMGFNLMENFRQPYLSKSISEFWKRWHISLSTWFKDYLYISLGGNRVARWRWQYNLFITFLVSGLWHGANWTYIIWGGLNGFYLVFSIWTQNIRTRFVKLVRLDKIPAVYKVIQILCTFSLICFAWIFFRAHSISDALYIITNMFSNIGNILDIHLIRSTFILLDITKGTLILLLLSIGFIEYTHYTQNVRQLYTNKPIVIRWAIYYAILFAIILQGVYGNADGSQFIYFQF